ncbi:MAG: hypothetical protein ACJA17_000510 [Polaribacter sp.]|jgi:hypothetical protein
MKKIKFLIIILLLSFNFKTSGQTTTSVTSSAQNASARIIVPLTIDAVVGEEMHFGTLMKVNDAAGATITLSPDATDIVDSDSDNNYTPVIVGAASGFKKPGKFTITGEKDLVFEILSSSADGLRLAGSFAGTDYSGLTASDQVIYMAANQMNVDKFTYLVDAGLAAPTNVSTALSSIRTSLSSASSGTFFLGADLTISATQEVGDYTGTYTVTVEYQ